MLSNSTKSLIRRYGSEGKHTKAKMPEYKFKPKPYKGQCYDRIVDICKNKTLNTSIAYKKPLLLHQGSLQWVYCYKGNRFLDMFAGVCTVNVGHCHPEMMKTVRDQLRMLVHCSPYYMQKNMHVYAEKLAAKLPGDLKKVYVLNTGTEANELALMLARLHTGHRDVLSLRAGFHGMSPITRALSGHIHYMYPEPERRGMIHLMNPDPYHGLWGGSRCRDSISQVKGRSCKCKEGDECSASKKYIEQLKETIKHCVPKGKLAALFMEPIQGVGGSIVHTKGYMKKAAEIVRSHGGLLVLDEVQTGFGRTGKTYFGFQAEGVVPDIIILGKGICSGFAMSVVVTTPKIAESLKQAHHLSTHAGNPFVTALAATNMDIIDKDCLMKNADEVGTYCLKKMMDLREKFPDCIGDVRGRGMSMGMEMVQTVKDQDGKPQKIPLCAKHMSKMYEETKFAHLLVGVGGTHENVFRFQPPLCLDKQDVDYGMQIMTEVISRHMQRMKGQGKDKKDSGKPKKCLN